MICRKFLPTTYAILMLALLPIAVTLGASESRSDDNLPGYQLPEPAVAELLTAMPPPEPLIHARSSQVALLFRQAVIPLERLSLPRLGLAGYRFDPLSGTSGVSPLVQRVELVDAGTDRRHQPLLWQPADSYGLDHVEFSSGGDYLSALRFSRDGSSALTLFALKSGKETVLDVPVNAAYGKPCSWAGAASLLCRVHPQREQQLSAARPAPVVIEHKDGPAPTRTYNNLLDNVHEDDLFEHYFDTELALVSVDGKVRRFSQTRGLISSFDPSADGSLVIIKRLQRPFSRLVPARRFPNVLEVWDLNSGTRLYQSPPSGYGVKREGSAPDRPHRVAWKPGSTRTAGFLRYHDPENAEQDPIKDAAPYRWWSVTAPFDTEPRLIASSEQRIERFGWTTAGTPYFFTRADDGGIDTWIIFEDGPQRIWSSGEAIRRYGEAGRAIRQDGRRGPVLEIDGHIYLTGYGNAQSGPQPFLDSYDLRDRKVERLFTAQRGVFEEILAILQDDARSLLTSRETEKHPPNLYRIDDGRRSALRPYPSPYPALDNAERQVIRYRRNDGLAMTGTLYLPATWQPGDAPLPTLIWIYPYEFADQEHAERLDVRGYRFHNVKGPSPLAAVLAGYAVLVNPTVPIVGEGDEVNDTYLEQLVASAEAAVDYLVNERISDPDRIAVGGRSYGAFSSANLLVHSRRFATAIAMSGAYNRTLTPFGFQHEKRSFWDAAEMYTKISPFFHANDIDAPILLVHGAADPNPGTPPLQARRFFHALVGEGVPVRYVELPHEAHHYWARESVLTTAHEMIDWLDRTIGRH